jgi:hypothetical protein
MALPSQARLLRRRLDRPIRKLSRATACLRGAQRQRRGPERRTAARDALVETCIRARAALGPARLRDRLCTACYGPRLRCTPPGYDRSGGRQALHTSRIAPGQRDAVLEGLSLARAFFMTDPSAKLGGYDSLAGLGNPDHVVIEDVIAMTPRCGLGASTVCGNRCSRASNDG